MAEYRVLPELFLRTPFYSFARYDPARLPALLGNVHFRNALKLASAVFFAVLEKKGFDFSRLDDREQHTLVKYYNRMCFRPVPFGHFASFTWLRWGSAGSIQLAPEAQTLLHLLPDNPSLPSPAGEMIIRNPTLYQLGKSWRYYRTLPGEGSRYTFPLEEIDAGRFNNDLLRQFGDGPVAAAALEDWIRQRSACTPGEANDYLGFLLEEQILYATNRGTVIRTEPPRTLPLPLTGKLAGGPYYSALERPLISGALAEADQSALLGAVNFLQQVAEPIANPALAAFTKAFYQRFERRWVPLPEALDPDTGISYGEADEIPAPDREALRLMLLRRWSADQVVLTDADLSGFARKTVQSPNTLAVMFRKTIAGLILESAAGASATQLTGRFSTFSEDAHRFCKAMAGMESEANPGILFADIAQLSDDHVDNVNRRRNIYPYEIPVNVYSGQPASCQLPPSDLLLSVQAGVLVMESRRLGKRVIPRLATAYNYQHNGLPLFRLLCDLQYQHGTIAAIEPAVLFPGMAAYPRLVYNDVILATAKWTLNRAELDRINTEGVRSFCRRHGLPAYIAMGDHDQQLVFNLSDPADQQFFLRCIQGKDQIRIQEYLLPDQTVKTGFRPMAGQFIAYFTHNSRNYVPVATPAPAPAKINRSFPPGSEWLYLKIYSTPATASRLLREVILPVMQREARCIRSWFFIRYADAGPHLRLRIRAAGQDTGKFLVALRARLNSTGLYGQVGGFLADTYHRELERYGPDMIGQAEQVFHAGSMLAIQQEGTVAEGFIAALEMTACFFPEPAQQVAFTGERAAVFLAEFKITKAEKIKLDLAYRSLKNEITALLPGNKTRELVVETARIAALAARKSGLVRKDLLASLVHMQLNRTFAEHQRRQEMEVWYFLNKYLNKPRLLAADQ